MHDLVIWFKGISLIALCWSVDFILVQFASLSILNPNVRDIFLESKDIINWVISIAVLYATILKIRNERRKLRE